jgi:DNA-binding NarL/FixJ family response regulator
MPFSNQSELLLSTILVIDYSPIMREGWKFYLKQLLDKELIVEASDIDEAEKKIQRFGYPKIITYHLDTINQTSTYKLAKLKENYPLSKLIIISGLSVGLIKSFCLSVEADCYILHSNSIDHILFVLGQYLISDTTDSEVSRRTNSCSLSDRQIQILKLVDSGLSNTMISIQLNIVVGSVKTHLSRIYKVLGTKSRTQAVFVAKQKELF